LSVVAREVYPTGSATSRQSFLFNYLSNELQWVGTKFLEQKRSKARRPLPWQFH
jgi:hypothetical protein